MYLSKHQGGNEVSVADHFDANEAKKWKRDVLEAYLGVTLKRMFSTGPEAFSEIRARLEQFAQSLTSIDAPMNGGNGQHRPDDLDPELSTLPPAVIETVSSLALAIDSKDHYTQGHSHKVAAYAAVIAEALGMQEEQIGEVRLGGMLHDIGKVGIPEEILNKNGPLNPDEWETMKQHVCFGDQLLEPLRAIASVREMVCHHHEMFDGSGYPDGLTGEQIPLGARIIAIADAFDTITSERTYKKARPASAGFAELERCAGTQFDPALVRLFVEAVQNLPHSPFQDNQVPASETVR
jgi:putative nucleotidyltransferase with HDIG domain